MFIDFMESDTGAHDAVTNAGTLSHTDHIHKWRGGGHFLNEPLPAVEWFAAARHMAESEHNKALKVFACPL